MYILRIKHIQFVLSSLDAAWGRKSCEPQPRSARPASWLASWPEHGTLIVNPISLLIRNYMHATIQIKKT